MRSRRGGPAPQSGGTASHWLAARKGRAWPRGDVVVASFGERGCGGAARGTRRQRGAGGAGGGLREGVSEGVGRGKVMVTPLPGKQVSPPLHFLG